MKENNEKTVSIKDGPILWGTYNIFNLLREVSVFQQIRNISKWLWERKYKKKHPQASKEEHDKAWIENRPFILGYLFPEIWVISNILLACIGCILVAKSSCDIIKWCFLVYAFLRTLEIFVYQINVLLFDPIKTSTTYKIKSATRTVLLLICNILEYILWFSVVYIFIYRLNNPDINTTKIIFESITTLANISSPNEFFESEKELELIFVAHIESVIGIFINIICLARFISLLPPVESIDKK